MARSELAGNRDAKSTGEGAITTVFSCVEIGFLELNPRNRHLAKHVGGMRTACPPRRVASH
jgi:hypothetical protein